MVLSSAVSSSADLLCSEEQDSGLLRLISILTSLMVFFRSFSRLLREGLVFIAVVRSSLSRSSFSCSSRDMCCLLAGISSWSTEGKKRRKKEMVPFLLTALSGSKQWKLGVMGESEPGAGYGDLYYKCRIIVSDWSEGVHSLSILAFLTVHLDAGKLRWSNIHIRRCPTQLYINSL